MGWPLNASVHPEQLARVGFVYTGEGSLVRCFQCGVRYRNWLKGDVPLSVHQKCNPRCAFLQTLTSKSKSTKEQRSTTSFIQPGGLSSSTHVAEELPKYAYNDKDARLQSFKYWGGVLPKEELAESGFYMIARRDVVRCFSCHVVLQDWERTDNVIEKHRRQSPNCPFLNMQIYSGPPLSAASSSVDKTYSPENLSEMKKKDYHRFNISLSSSCDASQPLNIEKHSHEPSRLTVNEGLGIVNDGLPRPKANEESSPRPIVNEDLGIIIKGASRPIINEGLGIESEGIPRSNDYEEQPAGICYPPSWESIPPTEMSPPPKSSDSEGKASSQNKLNYSALTSSQQSVATASQIVVSFIFVQLCIQTIKHTLR